MRLDAFGQPVIHRLHLDPGALKGPEGPLDHKESLITSGCILYRDGIVVGLKHPFSIELRCLLDCFTVEPDTALLIDFR